MGCRSGWLTAALVAGIAGIAGGGGCGGGGGGATDPGALDLPADADVPADVPADVAVPAEVDVPSDVDVLADGDVPPVDPCGNGVCDAGEDCLSCPADCTCRCGDGVCTLGEACRSCPADCDCTTLAATPPMGWNSWNRFACNISDALIRQMADAIEKNGMKEAGYEYVNLDDCWQVSRDADGTIVPDPVAFAPGMADLAAYVHGKGLKLGTYTCAGNLTCQKRPGSLDHEVQDMKTYAGWGIDYVKVDWCFTEGLDPSVQYPKFHEGLGNSRILLSVCDWGVKEPWVWGPGISQLWRTTGDISDTYLVMLANILRTEQVAASAGPGHWNDPDMLEVGNGGMSPDEYRTHMALWAVSAAPLIAGNDLVDMTGQTRELLLNPEVIAVDQDPAGVQGVIAVDAGDFQVWARPVTLAGARAVVLFNISEEPLHATVAWTDLGLSAGPAKVRDLWARQDLGAFQDSWGADLAPHASAFVLVQGTEPRPPSGESFLGDLPWKHSAGGLGPVERDRANGGSSRGDGGPLTLRGQSFAKGIGANAAALVLVHLGGACTRFRATVGIDDSAQGGGTAVFQVWGDGRKLFDSGVVTGTDAARAVDVALDGVRELRLFADPANDTAWKDLVDWADARVECR